MVRFLISRSVSFAALDRAMADVGTLRATDLGSMHLLVGGAPEVLFGFAYEHRSCVVSSMVDLFMAR